MLQLFLSIFFSATVCAQTSMPADIPLDIPDGFSATAIDIVGKEKYCVSGFLYNDAGPSQSAYVFLLDSMTGKVVWRTSLPPERGYIGSSATHCASNGDAYYVATEENTNSSESLNQTRVVLNKLSVNGRVLIKRPIAVGFDEWAYLLDVQPNAISVGGGASATLQRGGRFTTFLVQFDKELVRTNVVKMDSGAFWIGSSAKLQGQHMFVTGHFFPNKSSGGKEAFASSKVDFSSGKYVWSNYAFPEETRQAVSAFASDGSIYSAALTPDRLEISTINSAGKTVNGLIVKKPLCHIDAASLVGNVLSAIGPSCKDNASSLVVYIDIAKKSVLTMSESNFAMSAPQFDGHTWVGIAHDKKNGQLFKRIQPQGAEYGGQIH